MEANPFLYQYVAGGSGMTILSDQQTTLIYQLVSNDYPTN